MESQIVSIFPKFMLDGAPDRDVGFWHFASIDGFASRALASPLINRLP
jgi:hypothetical protein